MKDWNALASALYDGSFRPMFINGKWCPAQSGAEMDARNPANGSLLATVPQGGAADIDAAVKAARAAFEGPWAKFTPFERQALLLRIADKFEAEWERLCLSDTLDMGMPIQRTLANSRRVLGMLRFYAGQAVAIHGQTLQNSFPGEIYSSTVREPIGVVSAITGYNFPFLLNLAKIGPALLAGCTLVLKPSPFTPFSALLFGEVADEIAIVRSLVTEQINHDPAHTFMNTGTQISGRPCMGSWLLYGLGAETDDLPGYVVLTSVGGGQNQPIAARQWHSGFLPSRFQGVPFHAKGDPVLYVGNPQGVTCTIKIHVTPEN